MWICYVISMGMLPEKSVRVRFPFQKPLIPAIWFPTIRFIETRTCNIALLSYLVNPRKAYFSSFSLFGHVVNRNWIFDHEDCPKWV